MIYTAQITQFGRTWELDVLGSGTADDLRIDGNIEYRFVQQPTDKSPGVYPRALRVPVFDQVGNRGFISERLLNEELDIELSLDSNLYFKGISYAENRQRPPGDDEYSTSFTVSDGLERLGRVRWEFGTYTYTDFLREIFSATGIDLPIHLYTDWDEDNAVGDLPDVNRITVGRPDDTYLDALKRFCTDFGYQVFQDEGVWVVLSLAYYASDGITRWTITDSAVSSSTVNPVTALPVQYKTSQLDAIRGVGQSRVSFEWPILEGGFANDEFEGYTDDSFDAWDESGSPTQIEPNTGDFQAQLDSNADRLTQRLGRLLHSGDRFRIDARAIAEFVGSPDGSEDAEWLQVIFRNFDGTNLYLRNDGTVTTTETIISKDGATTSDLQYNEEVIIGNAAGFTDGFFGVVDVICRFDSKFDSQSQTNYFDSFDFQFVKVEFDQNTTRFSRRVSDVTSSNLPIQRTPLSISQNNRQFVGNEIEYYTGSEWLPSQVFSGDTFGIKRADDELRVRDSNLEIIRAEGDLSYFSGMMSLYTYEGVQYKPMSATFMIGEDDVSMFLVQHERSTDTYTENEFFDNGGEASVSSVGGSPSSGSSGGGGGGGLTETQANALYARQDNNLSDLTSASSGRANLGVEIGSDVQAWSANLDTLAGNDGSNLNNLNASQLTSGTVPSGRISGSYSGITGVGALNSGTITDGFGSIDIGTSALSAGAISGNTLRTDTGKFLSPVSYQFRNAGDTSFRDVEMAGLTATTGDFSGTVSAAQATTTAHLVRADRTISAGNGLTGGGDLTSNRTLTIGTPSTITVSGSNGVTGSSHTHALDLSGRTLTFNNEADDVLTWSANGQNLGADRTWTPTIADHGSGQRGVLNTEAQTIYGQKTFNSNALFSENAQADDFALTTDFNGTGWQGTDAGDFNVRSLVVREFARFRELIIDQLSAVGGSFLYSAARGKVESVSGNDITLEDPNDTGATQFAVNDIFVVRQVDVDGGEFKMITGRVSSVSGTTITLAQDISGTSGSISSIAPGDTIVQRGNTSNSDRQDLIYITSTDSDSPSEKFFSNVDSIAAFNDPANIITQVGRLDNLPDISGEGLYGSNVFLTESVLVGSLDKSGPYFEVDGDEINAVGLNLDVTSLPRVSDEGLVGLWRLDGSIIDATGNNSSTQDGGVFNPAVSDKGYYTNSNTKIETNFRFQGGSFTLCGWFEFRDTDTRPVQRFGSNDIANNARFYFGYSEGDVRTGLGDGFVNSSASLASNTPHFMEWKGDGSTCRVYVNRELIDSFSYTFSDDDNTVDFNIGNIESGSTGIFGFSDEVRIYNRETSDKESDSLYLYPSGNSGGLISTENLVVTGNALINSLLAEDAGITGSLTIEPGGVFESEVVNFDDNTFTLESFLSDEGVYLTNENDYSNPTLAVTDGLSPSNLAEPLAQSASWNGFWTGENEGPGYGYGTYLGNDIGESSGQWLMVDNRGLQLNTPQLSIDTGGNAVMTGTLTNTDEDYIIDSDGISLRARSFNIADPQSPTDIKFIDTNNDTVSSIGSSLDEFRVRFEDAGFMVSTLRSSLSRTLIRNGLTVEGSNVDFIADLPSIDPQQNNKWFVDNNGFVKVSTGGSSPSSPGGLNVCQQPSGLEFSWNAVSGAEDYEVQRSIDGASFQAYTTTPGTSILDGAPAIDTNTDYQYRVRACNSVGCSSYSTSTTTTYNSATAC